MTTQSYGMDKTFPQNSIYDELIDLIAQGGGPDAVIAFRPSEWVQERVYELIERKRDGAITNEEADQLLLYTKLEHILRMAKIRARLALKNGTASSDASQ